MLKSKERVFFTVVFEQISDITSICFDDYFMISQSNTFGKDDEILATSWISEKNSSFDTSCFWRVFLRWTPVSNSKTIRKTKKFWKNLMKRFCEVIVFWHFLT